MNKLQVIVGRKCQTEIGECHQKGCFMPANFASILSYVFNQGTPAKNQRELKKNYILGRTKKYNFSSVDKR